MSKLVYISHTGDVIELESELATVQTAAGIRGSEWIFNSRRNALVNLRHAPQEITLGCYVDDKLYLQQMQDVFDMDCIAEKPGVIKALGWSQSAYITSVEIDKVYQNAVDCRLTVQLLQGSWTKEQTFTGNKIVNTGVIPAAYKAVITGACNNPTFTIAGNVYKVKTNVSSTGQLEIDSRHHTIQYRDGRTLKSCFNLGERGTGKGCGTYIFEPIPYGTHDVKTNCNIDFTIYEERSGLPWSH